MQHGGRAAHCFRLGRVTASVAAMLVLVTGAGAASLQTFASLFSQVTNDLAFIQENFDNSAAQKQRLAVLTRARGTILNDALLDEQSLKALVLQLDGITNFAATLDESAVNARATVLARYAVLAAHVGDLPPSSLATSARNHFNSLAGDEATLAGAQHAAGISSLLAPFGRRLEIITRLVLRAQVMPRPRVGLNAVRAVVDGRAFTSAGSGPHSPNIFAVTAPGGLFFAVSCRVVDGSKVIYFTLPIVTDAVRYDVALGFATLAYTPDVFATNVVTRTAATGTFFVQRDLKGQEIFGVFSCAGPGLDVKDARFRLEIPRALRGP